MIEKPTTWNACAALLQSPDLEAALAVRLVELAFGDQGSVAVKAIEILRTMPRNLEPNVFSDLSREQLIEVEKQLTRYVEGLIDGDLG